MRILARTAPKQLKRCASEILKNTGGWRDLAEANRGNANPFDGITSDELAALANLHTIRWLLSAIERAIASMRPKKQR
jgi:hypothetical protein